MTVEWDASLATTPLREMPMSILPIRTINPLKRKGPPSASFTTDPVLRQKTRKVSRIDESVQKLIDDMIDTMYAAHGVGLAAPQVGVSLRVCVIGLPDQEPFALINPEIVKKSGLRKLWEGCLSIPGFQALVPRSEKVTVKALDRHGKEIRIRAENDLLAQALEHEIDHLDGVLYIDYLEDMEELVPVEPAEEKTEEVEVGL